MSGVGFQFGTHVVFSNFDWSVLSGVTALMGPNGAGKTTLLRLIAGSLRATTGVVEIEATGRGGTAPRPVGMLPQRYNLVDRMRVVEAVSHTAWSAGVQHQDIDGAVTEALARVGLDGVASAKVSTLSGGQRQRLGIACTLSGRPSVLLLDEPSVGLDPIQRRSLRDLLKELGQETPIVLSTHLVDDVTEIAERLAVLDEGRLLYDGELVDLIGNDSLESAYVDLIEGNSA
jgi:ABC-2 type transport system ATP-binding protein